MHPFALATGRHESGATQVGEMARYFRLTLREDLNEIANAHFPAVHQVQQPEPGAVGERGKQQGQIEILWGMAHISIIFALTDTSSE